MAPPARTDRRWRGLAAATALGAGLTALITGLTVTACAYAGVAAVAGHHLQGVALAVVVLTLRARSSSQLKRGTAITLSELG